MESRVGYCLRRAAIALVMMGAVWSCRNQARLDLKKLFAGFNYAGSAAALDPTAATPNADAEPASAKPDLAYYYRPEKSVNFYTLGSKVFVERLKEQGFEISSAPGVNGGDFNVMDRRTIMFVVGFHRGECHGAVTGMQKADATQLYFVKLQPGC